MKNITLRIATLVLSAACLSACSHHGATNAENKTPAAYDETTASTTPSSATATTETKSKPEFPNVDKIRWDEVKNPLIDDAMKEKLRASVDAIVARDVDAFHKSLGPNVGTEHDYLLDNPVQFTHVDETHEEGGRILVLVMGEMRIAEDSPREMGYTFYFEKDSGGEWQIVTID